MFKAEVDLAVLVENLISKFTGVMAIKPLLLIVILLKKFNQEVQNTEVACNCHSHTFYAV